MPRPGGDPLFTVRVGGYFVNNNTVRHSVNSTFLCGGLDYAIQHPSNLTRTIVSVDYIDRTSGNNTLRVFPVTAGQLILQPYQNGIQPYYGAGAGGYFVHQDFNNNSSSNRNSHDNVVFGGYLVAGVEYRRYLDLDARYHIVTSSNSINVGGLELTAGFRF